MVEWVAALLGGGDPDAEVVLNFVLPDVFVEVTRPQRRLKRFVFGVGRAGNDAVRSHGSLRFCSLYQHRLVRVTTMRV